MLLDDSFFSFMKSNRPGGSCGTSLLKNGQEHFSDKREISRT
jgi:hypothetical protein